jgi:hypothetical protein
MFTLTKFWKDVECVKLKRKIPGHCLIQLEEPHSPTVWHEKSERHQPHSDA